MPFHEELFHEDIQFPIIFHTDLVYPSPATGGAHWHSSVEMLYTLSGSGYTLIDGMSIPMQPGDLVVVPSGSIHVTRAADEPCRYYCLIVDLDFLSRRGLWQEYDRLPLCLKRANAGEIFRLIDREICDQPAYYKEQVRALVALLFVSLRRNHPVTQEENPLGTHGRLDTVRKAISAIDREYEHPITLDYLCHVAGMSKYYFCRAFKQATGQTVTQYINWVRCSHARRLLASGECNVGEAAERCGFHNLSYFTRVYRRQYGRVPSKEKAAEP